MVNKKTIASLTLGVGVLTAAGSASANSLGLSFKGSFLGVDTSKKVGDGDETTSNTPGFKMQWARLDYKAKASKDTSYRLRLRFDKGADTSSNGQSPLVDFAYVTHHFADAISVSLGRQKTFNAGAYGAYYFAKEGFYMKNDLYGLITRFSGAKITLHPDDKQTVSLSVSNTAVSEKGEKEGTVTESKSPMIGLVYKGNFGAIKPFFSYYTSPVGKTTVEKDDTITMYEGGVADTFTSIGSGINSGDLFGSVDLILATQAGRKAVGADKAGDDTEHQSINVLGGYKIGAFKPIVAIESTTKKKGDVTDTKTGFGLTVEYYPDTEVKGLRYYTGMTQVSRVTETKKDDTTTETTVNQNTVYLGVALNASTKLL